MSELKHFYQTYIRSSADKIWQALTDPEFTVQYFHATRVQSSWQSGSTIEYLMPDDSVAVTGEVIECNPPSRLAITWQAKYSPELANEPPSRVVFEITELEDGVCRLSVTHDNFQPGSKTFEQIQPGWDPILCSLKSLLETGSAMPIPQNL
ncbi:MAG: SRPBCC family protein [Gammaproteobacteria bacterium]